LGEIINTRSNIRNKISAEPVVALVVVVLVVVVLVVVVLVVVVLVVVLVVVVLIAADFVETSLKVLRAYNYNRLYKII
jgi:hypothetical protein